MAKKIKKILAIAMVLILAVSLMSVTVFARKGDDGKDNIHFGFPFFPGYGNGDNDSDKYEWYEVYVQGELVKSDRGEDGDIYWLGIDYNASCSVDENNQLHWEIVPNQGTNKVYEGDIDLNEYIDDIPEGYKIGEIVISNDIDGVNDAVFDQYDNAIISITVKTIINPDTGDVIEIPEPDPVNPDPDNPDPDNPDPDNPDPDNPDPDNPDPDNPDPDNPNPDNPDPDNPDPDNPDPDNPDPDNPDPDNPDPDNPDPDNPDPDNPDPDNPDPDNPDPDNPDPVDPDPVDPDPVDPDPVDPDPVDPDPVDPDPVDPDPVVPVVPVNPPVIPYIPPVEPVVEDLPDEDVPLAELPEEDADDGLEDIFDEDVPLADVPQTGTAIAAFSAVAALSGIGLAWFGLKKKDN